MRARVKPTNLILLLCILYTSYASGLIPGTNSPIYLSIHVISREHGPKEGGEGIRKKVKSE